MRRPIVSKSERSGTGVAMANLSKAVCHGESDKCRFGNPPQESNFQRLGISHRRDRRYALRLPSKTSFTEELVRSMNCDDCFLALLRNDGDLHLASLDVEDRIRRISL